jgi:hypothetical protein
MQAPPGAKSFRRFRPRILLSPAEAVAYIIWMDPRAAAAPLAGLFSSLIAVSLGALLGVPLAYMVSWVGVGGTRALSTLAVAPVIGVICFVASYRHLRREPPNVHMRAALLLLFAGAAPITAGPLGFVLMGSPWPAAATLGGLLCIGSLIWWPAYVIVGERRLARSLRPVGAICGACGYDLSGLPRPVCPECGREAAPPE